MTRTVTILLALLGIADSAYLGAINNYGPQLVPGFLRAYYSASHPQGSGNGILGASFWIIGLVGMSAILALTIGDNRRLLAWLGWEKSKPLFRPALLTACLIGCLICVCAAFRSIFIIKAICPFCALAWLDMWAITALQLKNRSG